MTSEAGARQETSEVSSCRNTPLWAWWRAEMALHLLATLMSLATVAMAYQPPHRARPSEVHAIHAAVTRSAVQRDAAPPRAYAAVALAAGSSVYTDGAQVQWAAARQAEIAGVGARQQDLDAQCPSAASWQLEQLDLRPALALRTVIRSRVIMSGQDQDESDELIDELTAAQAEAQQGSIDIGPFKISSAAAVQKAQQAVNATVERVMEKCDAATAKAETADAEAAKALDEAEAARAANAAKEY